MSVWSRIRGYVVAVYQTATDNDEKILAGMQDSMSKMTPIHNSEMDLQVGLMQIKKAAHGEQWQDEGHRQFMISLIASQRDEDVKSLKTKIEQWLDELRKFAYIAEMDITIEDDYGVEAEFTKHRYTPMRIRIGSYYEDE